MLGDLKDPTQFKEAFRFSGKQPEFFSADDLAGSTTKEAIERLQRITGITDDKTVDDLQKVYGNKVATIMKKILDNPELFPPTEAYDTKYLRNHILTRFRSIMSYIGGEEGHPELAKRIETETQSQLAYVEERN